MERTALTPFLTTSTSNPISALAWLNAQQFVTGGSEVVRVWRIDTIAEKARDPSKPPPPPKYLLKESFSGEHVLGVYSLAVQDGGERACAAPAPSSRAPFSLLTPPLPSQCFAPRAWAT